MNTFFGLKFLSFSFLLFYINCCSPGYYLSSGKCIPCQSGYYSQGSISSTKLSKCEECPEGTYSEKGSSKCNTCPAGTFSKSKSSKCQKCPKGTFSKKGESSCIPCPEKYFADTEGSAYCKQCPKNTYSKISSSSCFECPEGDILCSGPSTKSSKIKRKNSEKDDKKKELEEFGKLMTSDIFGKSIEFVNYQATFTIPQYIVIATIFSEITFDLVEDLHFLIKNHRFGNMVYNNYEIFKNITEIADKIIDALKGEISISIPGLEQKIGEHITNGEVTVTYYLLLNAIEITIISKLTDEIGTEYEVGVKYKIIPIDNNPPPVLEPAKEENYVENFLTQLSKKSKEYIYYAIDFIKSPEVIAVVGGAAIVVLTVVLLSTISGLSIPALITGAMTALLTLLQNGIDILSLRFA